ncbi:ATP binding domain 4 [Rhizophlyctis rosea]|nr:ATP binding domain 4 [Rhizophlyctis rosea]
MYQTVGHDAIGFYADCMALPLFRRAINGSSAAQGADYVPTVGDEVEDLFLLLSEVKSQIPSIEAVATGAILSNYQRVRVENVCARLGLKSLAYLWRRDQTELMREMIESGLQAILIKVAALGLKEIHLGKSLGQMYPHLLKMHDQYGAHVCGEGGEFETLTLDCPIFVKRIVIDEVKRVLHSDDAFAPVAYLNVTKAHVEDKDPDNTCRDPTTLRERLDFDGIFGDSIVSGLDLSVRTNEGSLRKISMANASTSPTARPSQCRYNTPFFVMSGATLHDTTSNEGDLTLEEEVHAVMEFVQGNLERHGLNWTHVTLMHVYVADMSNFARVNEAYGKYFGLNPPPRVTVEIPLQKSTRIQIDCMAFKPPTLKWEKETMHVQSVSYWAPANIGPYSQAVLVADHAYTAGMIGLVPHSMDLPPAENDVMSLIAEISQSLKSLAAVVDAIKLDLKRDAAGCVCYVSDGEWVGVARMGWEGVLEERKIPICFVVVPRLPRDAKVEWQVVFQNPGTLWARKGRGEDDDNDDDDDDGNGEDGEEVWEVDKEVGGAHCRSEINHFQQGSLKQEQ